MSANEKMLKSASFGSLMLKMALPAVVITLVMVIYNIADIFFIGKLGDPYMIAAVGLAGPMFSVLSGLGILFGSGGCTAISLALGKGDRDKINKISSFCFWGSVLLGVLFTAAALVFLKPLCGLLGADDTTRAYTEEYLGIIAMFAPVSVFSSVFQNIIRADGTSVKSLISNLAGTAANIILDPLFILVFGWGIKGAALATGIGNTISALIVAAHLMKHRDVFSVRLRDALPGKAIALSVVSLGLPMAISTLLASFSGVIGNNLIAAHDTIALAATGVAGRATMLNVMVAMGICIGIQPAISYNYSAGNGARTAEILRKTGITVFLTSAAISAVTLLFRDAFITLFIDNAAVLDIGRIALTAGLIGGPLFGLYQMTTTYFQATDRAGYATFCSLLNKFIIYVPVHLAANALFGLYGLLYAGLITDVLSFAAAGAMAIHTVVRPQKTALPA